VEAWLVEALRQQPEAVELTSKLGVIRILQGRYDEAEGLLRGLLARHPECLDALNNLAWLLALRDQQKAHEAGKLIDHAIDLAGASAPFIDTRAIVRIQMGKADQAIGDLQAIRRQSPRNASFAFHLSWAYFALGRTAQARTELHEAEQLGLTPKALDPLELAVFQRLRRELISGRSGALHSKSQPQA
jgi:predicted Zn-dependent protease